MHVRRGLAAAAVAVLPLSLLAAGLGGPAVSATPEGFTRVATYPVFQNAPTGVKPELPTVAEISAVTEDGKTLVYTDALGQRVGLLNITDPAAPQGLGSIDVKATGNAHDEPTSVAVVGDFVLVVVDSSVYRTSASDPAAETRTGRLDIYRLSDRTRVRSIDLGGQPDSIAISPDQAYAAIAIENQRNENVLKDGGGGAKGDLPQAPAGKVVLVDLVTKTDPASWTTRDVALTKPDGSALATLAGLDAPTDPEPEYVTINGANKLALTLQENNGIVVIDVPTGAIDTAFSAGVSVVDKVDVTKDGLFNPTGKVNAPREPDSIGWVDATHVATANEGDWKGGTRDWTIFDTTTGTATWQSGNELEQLATARGLHNNDRAAKKGVEPEGLTIATIGGKVRAFVGSERSNFVAVYDLTNPAAPVIEQILPTTNGPEGLLAVPSRNLFVVSSETDDAAKGVRATVGVYQWGATTAQQWPSIISTDGPDALAIGWGALGALSAVPGQPGRLYAASDSAYKTGRIYTVDVSSMPATITKAIDVTAADGTKPAIDIEGLSAEPDGTFWVAVEGTTGAGNQLVRLDASGKITETVTLPAELSSKIGKWGFEGVTGTGATATAPSKTLYVAVQRPLWVDPADATKGYVDGAGLTRILRYDVAAKTWTSFKYPLETTTVTGDWLGLSEITAVNDTTFAVIERDKLNGPAAAVKRVYTVQIPANAAEGTTLTKKLAVDVLPTLKATKGWTQEKLEGLTIGADGNVYAVTDNDGLVDATGETVFMNLGKAATIFAAPTTPTSTPTTSPSATASATVTPTVRPTTTPKPSTSWTPSATSTATPAPKVGTKTVLRAKVVKVSKRQSAKHRGRIKVVLRAQVKPGIRAVRAKISFVDSAGSSERTLGAATVNAKGVVRRTLWLPRGKHTLQARYVGNSTYAPSVSNVVRLG